MAIGATRVHGGVGAEGEINGNTGAQLGSSLAFFHIMARRSPAPSAFPVDLRGEVGFDAEGQSRDGGLGLAVEKILQTMPSGVISYNVANNATGNIYVICDGTNVPSATVVQTAIRALGGNVGTNDIDLRGTLVTAGTTFTVA
jgi:hypothetical protein